jgi:hypothetical protein
MVQVKNEQQVQVKNESNRIIFDKNDWQIVLSDKATKPHHCICGHHVKRITYIYNKNTKELLCIGTTCVKKYGIHEHMKNGILLLFIKNMIHTGQIYDDSVLKTYIQDKYLSFREKIIECSNCDEIDYYDVVAPFRRLLNDVCDLVTEYKYDLTVLLKEIEKDVDSMNTHTKHIMIDETVVPLENSADIIEDATDIIEDATDIIEDATDIIEDATDIIEDATDIIEDATDIIEDATDIIEDAADIIEDFGVESIDICETDSTEENIQNTYVNIALNMPAEVGSPTSEIWPKQLLYDVNKKYVEPQYVVNCLHNESYEHFLHQSSMNMNPLSAEAVAVKENDRRLEIIQQFEQSIVYDPYSDVENIDIHDLYIENLVIESNHICDVSDNIISIEQEEIKENNLNILWDNPVNTEVCENIKIEPMIIGNKTYKINICCNKYSCYCDMKYRFYVSSFGDSPIKKRYHRI